jgi:hypothetical protein
VHDSLFQDLPAFLSDPEAREFERPSADDFDFSLNRCELFAHQVEQLTCESRDECVVGAASLTRVCEHSKHMIFSGVDHIVIFSGISAEARAALRRHRSFAWCNPTPHKLF